MPTQDQTRSHDVKAGPAAPPLPDALWSLIREAVDENATDVHLDMHRERSLLRFRVDGKVHRKQALTQAQAERLINQIKVAGEVGVDALHVPGEGRLQWVDQGRTRDIRVTVVPAKPDAEAAHLRLLTPPGDGLALDDLGLPDREVDRIGAALHSRRGLVLTTGMTGSGKTTTLYALAGADALAGGVTVAIEDPVEFDLPGVRQLEVDEQRGLTMEVGLRTLLRMDADTIMVGEVRDRASAALTGRAALSGRLALATLHARDAAAAVDAMHYLSVPFYVLGAALRLVVAQRLVRMVCPHCHDTRELGDAERKLFDRYDVEPPDAVCVAQGCTQCNGYGYRGRTGVFEVAAIDQSFGAWLSDGRHQDEIRRRLLESGMRPMQHDALAKVASGRTTLHEVMPWLHPDQPI